MDVAIATPIQISEVAPTMPRPALAAGFVSAVLNIAAPLYQDDAADTKTRYKMTAFARPHPEFEQESAIKRNNGTS